MVVIGDHVFEAQTGEPTDEGHYGLEGSEKNGHANAVADLHIFACAACGDRDCEGVHREADSNNNNSEQFCHWSSDIGWALMMPGLVRSSAIFWPGSILRKSLSFHLPSTNRCMRALSPFSSS